MSPSGTVSQSAVSLWVWWTHVPLAFEVDLWAHLLGAGLKCFVSHVGFKSFTRQEQEKQPFPPQVVDWS